MAEDRLLAAGEDRGEPPPPPRQRRVTDRVSPSPDPVQPPDPETMLDRILAEPECTELRAPDDSVLTRRQLGDLPLSTSRSL
jgi:hypothetical protein